MTLAVISWATRQYGEAVARTMGVIVFSLANIWFALETYNEERSMFSTETLENPTLLKGAAVAFVFTIVATSWAPQPTARDGQPDDRAVVDLPCVVSLAIIVAVRGQEAAQDPDDGGGRPRRPGGSHPQAA